MHCYLLGATRHDHGWVRKSISHCNAPVLAWFVEGKLIEAVQVGYDMAKEGVKTPLFTLVGNVIAETIQQGKMNSLLMRCIEAPTEPERLMDVLTWRVDGCQWLILPSTGHVKHHMNKIVGENGLLQRVQQKFLEITYHSPLATLMGEAVVVTPPTWISSKVDLGGERRRWRKRRTECHNDRSHITCSTLPESDNHRRENIKSPKPQF